MFYGGKRTLVMPVYRCLGTTDLKAFPVGLGGWAFGGGLDWGDISETDCIKTVHAALDEGINLIDTAPVYGNGLSEERIGKAIKDRREKVILADKCGLVKNGYWTDHDLRSETIIKQLENSLRLLQTDYIDLYQIHYPDPKVPLEDALGTLMRLKQEGKIRYIGVCNVSHTILQETRYIDCISAVQNHYSLLKAQEQKEVLDWCADEGAAFLGYGTLGGGILSGKYKKEPNLRRADARNYFYKTYRAEGFVSAHRTAERVKKIAQDKQVYPSAVAAAWALHQRAVSLVLTGARNAEQIIQNATAGKIFLTEQEIRFLEGKDDFS